MVHALKGFRFINTELITLASVMGNFWRNNLSMFLHVCMYLRCSSFLFISLLHTSLLFRALYGKLKSALRYDMMRLGASISPGSLYRGSEL